MSEEQSVGYIKTFSSGLGRGAAEVSVEGDTISVSFTSKVVRGLKSQLRSGDRVTVTLEPESGKKPRVVAIEYAPDSPPASAPAASNGRLDDLLEAVQSSTNGLTAARVPVPADGRTQARFTKENFVRNASRLDFGPSSR